MSPIIKDTSSTGRGIVLNYKMIMTEHGCKIEFKSGLKKGTDVWLHYENGVLVMVEPFFEDI